MICPEKYIKVGNKAKVDAGYLAIHSPKDPDKFWMITRVEPSIGCFYIEGVGTGFRFDRIREMKGYFSHD